MAEQKEATFVMTTESEDMERDAHISPCKKFRYFLSRVWDPNLPKLCIFGLNCSTADAKKDDPTVRREIGFAKCFGYGSLWKGNIFAYRTKDPAKMKRAKDPIGPDNDMWIKLLAGTSDRIVVAWGSHGSFMDRDKAVVELLKGYKLWCFGMTGAGQPKHPLYLAAGDHEDPDKRTKLMEWTPKLEVTV